MKKTLKRTCAVALALATTAGVSGLDKVANSNNVVLADTEVTVQKPANPLTENVLLIGNYEKSVELGSSFVLPTACINVETGAFANCKNLELVKVGRSVKNISSFAFTLSPKISIECKNNPVIKNWATRQSIPIHEAKLNAFLDSINTEKERGDEV